MDQYHTYAMAGRSVRKSSSYLIAFIAVFLIISGIHNRVNAQLPPGEFNVENGGIYTPQYLVENILIGQGVEVSNVTYSGNNQAIGYFIGESTISLNRGVVMSSGHCLDIDNTEAYFASSNNNSQGDNDLRIVASRCNDAGNAQSNDACLLEFDFIPQSTEVEFKYVFGSEEYPSTYYPPGYVGSQYNDSFGFFISGPGITSFGVYSNDARNIALIPNTNEEVCINSINEDTNPEYFVNNIGGTNGVTFGGHTTVLIARAQVQPCQTYHIKLAISDMGDDAWDSGVFLEANSFSSVGVQTNVAYTHAVVDTAVEACNDATVGFALSGKTLGSMTIHYTIEGLAQNGIDYEYIPDSVVIQGMDSIAFIEIIPINDGEPEAYEDVQFIYNTSLCDPPVWDTTYVWIKDNYPMYIEPSESRPIECGQLVPLYVGASQGQQPYSFLWSTGDTTEIINVSPLVTTTYDFYATDICGHDTAGTITLTVLPPDAIVDDTPLDMCLGGSVMLQVQGGMRWKWSAVPYDPTLIPFDTLQTPTVSPGDTTIYKVVVYDDCGGSDSAYITVNVGDIIASAWTDTPIVCSGQSAHLEANIITNATYQWFDASNNFVGSGQSIDVYPPGNMTYSVQITESVCSISDTAYVSVQVTNMTVTSSNDTTVCPNARVDLLSSSSLGNGTYIWTDENGNYIGNMQSATVYPDVTTMYIVTVTDQCTKNDTVVVNIFNINPVIITALTNKICPGDSLVLNATGTAVNYTWTSTPADASLIGQENSLNPEVKPQQNTQYSLEGIDANGCLASDDYDVQIKPKPSADFDKSLSVQCEGQPITFSYTGGANTSDIYNWDFGGIPRTGQGPHNISWPAMGTKTISLIVTQNACISDAVTQTVEINPSPHANFNMGTAKGCVPLTVDFTNISTNTTSAATYLWDFGAAGTSAQESPSYEFSQPGQYNVSLMVSNPGCSDIMSIPVAVDAWPVPVAEFSADPVKVSLKNPNVTFTSTSTEPNLTYLWETGDGNVYDVPNFTHTYVDSGYFHVVMEITNEFGCVDSKTMLVTITPKYMIRVPTAFTPNGDGKNDTFGITGNGVQKFRISIYNRWGNLVFESTDIHNSWDGKINGAPALPGVYVYHTYFMDDNDEVSEQTGSFTLIK